MKNPQEVLEQLRSVLATTLDATVRLVPGTMSASGWRVRLTPVGQAPLTITFEAGGASALAAALGTPDAVAAVLEELCSHAVATPMSAPSDHVAIAGAEFVDEPPVQGITVAGLHCDKLTVPLAVSVGRGVTAEATRGKNARAGAGRFGVLMDIELPMVVRFGCTDMPLKALSNLGPGSLIDLSRAPEDPVEVLVGGRVVARGEVVVVSGSYGIRIVDVVEGRSQAPGVEA